MSDAEKIKAAVHWMDTMKERLDHYEVHRNEFLSDMRLPPRNVKFLREVLLPFCENTLLLDNLAKSEGLGYLKPEGMGKAPGPNRLQVHCHFHEHDSAGNLISSGELVAIYPELRCIVPEEGCPGVIRYPDRFPYLVKSKDFKSIDDRSLDQALKSSEPRLVISDGTEAPFNDFEICLPSEHAFYSILENVIRNSAKHNAGKFPDEGLRIFIDICADKADPDHFTCTIYDNVSCMPLSRAASKMDLGRMIGKKDEPLLKEGRPNRANMGMADMKINAFLLHSGNDFKEEDLNKALEMVVVMEEELKSCAPERFRVLRVAEENVRFVKQRAHKAPPQQEELEAPSGDTGKEYRFGYHFKLTKAKKVAWIGKAIEDPHGAFKAAGIYSFATWDKYTASLGETLAAYDIAVLEKEAWQELNKADCKELRQRLAQLPFRVLVNDCGTVPVPFNRRVVKAAISVDCSADNLLLTALDVWNKGKYDLGDGDHLFLRAILIEQEDRKPPKAIATGSVRAQVCFLKNGTRIIRPDNEAADPVDCIQHKGRLAVIDHHGKVVSANMVTANGATDNDDKLAAMARWACLWNGYAYVDKQSKDYDHIRSTLGGSVMAPVTVSDMTDLFLRKVVVLDERFGALASESVPAKDARVRPSDQWGYWAAANMYVVTKLTGTKNPIEFQVHSDSNTSLEFNVCEARLTITPKQNNGDTIAVGDPSLCDQLAPLVDVLVIHRTYWLSFEDDERKRLFDTFGEIILTSGAGKPEKADGVKYISFATFSMLARSPLLAKLALTKTLGGLITQPH